MVVLVLRSRTVLFFSMLLPTFSLVLFGTIFRRYEIPLPVGDVKVSYAVWLLPGIIVTNMMATGMMGGSGGMIAWRERGIFQRILVTPMAIWQVMLARIIAQLGVVVAQAVVAVIVAVAVFGYRVEVGYIPLTVAFLTFGGLVFLSFGQVIASFTDRVEVGSIVSQGIYIILTFLTGVMLPLQLLPSEVGQFAPWTPSFLVVELLRAAMIGGVPGPDAVVRVIGLLGYFVAAVATSAAFFRMLR